MCILQNYRIRLKWICKLCVIFCHTNQSFEIITKSKKRREAGIALNCQCDFVSITVPSEVFVKEKYLAYEEEKKISRFSKFERNAASSRRSLMANSVTAFRILIKYIGGIFLRLEVFKEFVLNPMLEAVDIS